MASGRASEAVSFLEANRAPARADAELALGHAYLNSGDPAKGIEILRHLYLTMPLSTEAVQAGAELIAKGSSLTGSYGDLKKRARCWQRQSLAGRGARVPAIAEYGSAGGARRDRSGARQCAAAQRRGGAREGRDLLEHAQATGEANAQRLYELVEIARTEGNESDLLNYLAQFRQSAPTSAWFQPALISAGNMYMLKKDYDHAIDYYREAYERFPATSRAAYAHWKVAWLSYRQGRTEEAKKEFTQHLRSYPASPEIAAAIYWRARIAEDENELPLARGWYAKVAERYRNYYYGHLAAERLAKIGVSPSAHDPVLDTIAPLAPLSARGADQHTGGDVARGEKQAFGKCRNDRLRHQGIAGIRRRQGGELGDAGNCPHLSRRRPGHRALRFMKSAVPSYFAIDYFLPSPALLGLPVSAALLDRKFAASPWRTSLILSWLRPSYGRSRSSIRARVSRANAFGLMQLLPSQAGKPQKNCASAVSERRRCWFPTSTFSSERAIFAKWSITTTARWSTRWPLITPAPTAWKNG